MRPFVNITAVAPLTVCLPMKSFKTGALTWGGEIKWVIVAAGSKVTNLLLNGWDGRKRGKKPKTKQKQKPAGNDDDDDDDNPLRPTCTEKKSNRTKPQLNFSSLAKIM